MSDFIPILVLLVILGGVFAYTYAYHKDKMSNALANVTAWFSGAVLVIKPILVGIDYQTLLQYTGRWETFAAMLALSVLIAWARSVPAE